MDDFSIICRICMSKDINEFTDLDGFLTERLTFLDCLNFCANIEATTSDGLPLHICPKCSETLKLCFEFIKTAQHSNQVLRLRNELDGNNTIDGDIDSPEVRPFLIL